MIEEADVAAGRWIIGLVTVVTLAFAGTEDELPAIGAHIGFFIFEILAEDPIARRVHMAVFEVRAQALAVLDGEAVEAQDIDDSGGNVDVFGEIVDDPLANFARQAQEQGDAQGGIVATMFFETAMLTETVPMIGVVDDERVVFKTEAA